MAAKPYPGFGNRNGGSARAFQERLERIGWEFGRPMSERIAGLPEDMQPLMRKLVQQAEEGL